MPVDNMETGLHAASTPREIDPNPKPLHDCPDHYRTKQESLWAKAGKEGTEGVKK